jgi:phosphonate transport system substrate-binding protein
LPVASQTQDWKAEIKEFRLCLLGGENIQDRLADYSAFQKLLQTTLGVPVRLFPAAGYAGVMHGIAAGQLEATEFSPAAFAGAWLDCKCVEPVIVTKEKDGSVYCISAMVTRRDSGITSLDQMKGHSLAWADPNSASGYLIPRATLRNRHRSGGRQVLLPHRLRRGSRTGRAGHAEPAIRCLRDVDVGPGRHLRGL